MHLRRAIVAVIVIASVSVVWWLGRPAFSPSVPAPSASPVNAVPPTASKSTDAAGSAKPPPGTGGAARQPTAVQPVQTPATVAPPPAVPTPRPARTAYMPPEPTHAEGFNDLENTNRMLKDYRQIMGENPVGTNAEIMKSLMGGNRKGAILGPPQGMNLNGSGELTDQWGMPIFFHALSKEHMEIRSAGPDRVMWTGDDVVFK